MIWFLKKGFERRAIVAVDSQGSFLNEIVQQLAATDASLLESTTLVSMEDWTGRDSRRQIRRWLERTPKLQIVTWPPAGEALRLARDYPERWRLIAPSLQSEPPGLPSDLIAALVRPGGLLFLDARLECLQNVSVHCRCHAGCLSVAQVLARFPQRPLDYWLVSDQLVPARLYRRLASFGLDTSRILEERDPGPSLVSVIEGFLEDSMPLWLRIVCHGEQVYETVVSDVDFPEVMAALDIGLWQVGGALRLGGRAVANQCCRLPAESAEGKVWTTLFKRLFNRSDDVSGGPATLHAADARADLTDLMKSRLIEARASSVFRVRPGNCRLSDRILAGWALSKSTARTS